MRVLINLVAFASCALIASSVNPSPRLSGPSCPRISQKLPQAHVTGITRGQDKRHDRFIAKGCKRLISENKKRFPLISFNPSDTNSVSGVTYRPGRRASLPGSSSGVDDPRLPQMVEARVSGRHLGCLRKSRDFGGKWSRRMRFMNATSNDEKGHIVAAQLCGPAEWYNLSPQTSWINRNVAPDGGLRSNWNVAENAMRRWLEVDCGAVALTVLLNYEPSNSRPIGFKVCTSFRDGTNAERTLNEAYYSNEYLIGFNGTVQAASGRGWA